MLLHWIWFAGRTGIQDHQKAALMKCFSDAEDIFRADEDAYLCLDILSREQIDSLLDKDLTAAEQILTQCRDKKIHILTYRDAAYPERLRNIPDPPMVLYYKGILPDMDNLPLIGVVGTRKASYYGLNAARWMGEQIAACGGMVVSGLATGVDSMAMAGALARGAGVIGVLGCGVDVVYPAANREMYARTEQCGCLLSEYPPQTPPMKWHFPRRNRIISGISCGVLVVEAPEKSGALITAELAAEYGRDVFAVPGNIDLPSCRGTNALLRSGAIAAGNGWDVMEQYAHRFPGLVRKADGALAALPHDAPGGNVACEEKVPVPVEKSRKSTIRRKEKPGKQKKEIDNGASPLYSDAETKKPALNETERKVLDRLNDGCTLVDELIAVTGLSAATVSGALTMLQIKGMVRLLPGNRVERNK